MPYLSVIKRDQWCAIIVMSTQKLTEILSIVVFLKRHILGKLTIELTKRTINILGYVQTCLTSLWLRVTRQCIKP